MNRNPVVATSIGLHNLAAIANAHARDACFESVAAIIVVALIIDTAADDLFTARRKITVGDCCRCHDQAAYENKNWQCSVESIGDGQFHNSVSGGIEYGHCRYSRNSLVLCARIPCEKIHNIAEHRGEQDFVRCTAFPSTKATEYTTVSGRFDRETREAFPELR